MLMGASFLRFRASSLIVRPIVMVVLLVSMGGCIGAEPSPIGNLSIIQNIEDSGLVFAFSEEVGFEGFDSLTIDFVQPGVGTSMRSWADLKANEAGIVVVYVPISRFTDVSVASVARFDDGAIKDVRWVVDILKPWTATITDSCRSGELTIVTTLLERKEGEYGTLYHPSGNGSMRALGPDIKELVRFNARVTTAERHFEVEGAALDASASTLRFSLPGQEVTGVELEFELLLTDGRTLSEADFTVDMPYPVDPC